MRPSSWWGGAALGASGPLPFLPVGSLLGLRLWGGFSPLPLGALGAGVDPGIIVDDDGTFLRGSLWATMVAQGFNRK